MSYAPHQFLIDPKTFEYINDAINRLKQVETQQTGVDNTCEHFCETVKSCMSKYLESKTVHVSSRLHHKRWKVKIHGGLIS